MKHSSPPDDLATSAQLGNDVVVHHVEFRVDGVIEVTISDRDQMGERAAITKLVALDSSLLRDGELADVIDTITDWTDLAWRHIREA